MFQLKNRSSRGKAIAAGLALPLVLLSAAAFAEGDGKWRGGENVYEKVCGRCHEIGVGPVITGRQLPVEYIQAIVRNGFRAMPAWTEAYIDNKSLQEVAEYIQKSPAPAAPAKP
jgi:mono/diheme cytochrome c family protein